MAVHIQLRGGTAAAWTAANPILAARELCVETDTGKFKVGDGTNRWTDLSYFTQGAKGDKGDTGNTGAAGTNGTDGTDGANAYIYLAYASADDGTDFTTTFDAALNYIAVKSTTVAIPAPAASDFAGLWKNYKGATGAQGAQGIQGIQGIQGNQGIQGAQGIQGVKGNTGAQGPAGTAMPIADAGGTVDAITADYTPDIDLTDKRLCAFVAGGANTSTTPTFAPDGLTAHTIVKRGGTALAAGDIPGAGAVCLLEYNLANTRWELLNPAAGDVVTFASAAELITGTEAAKSAAPDQILASGIRANISNLKLVVNASVNKLDIFSRSGGAAPDASNPISVAIPDGNGNVTRVATAEAIQFILADAANYWSKGSDDTEIKTMWLYAAWSTADSKLVWMLRGYSGFSMVSESTTVTDDDYNLLPDGSTYTRAATDYCVAVAKLRYKYYTADTPDHTIQASGGNAPQIIWNPKSDYGYQKNLATTNTSAGDIVGYSAVSVVIKQSGTYYISAHCMAASLNTYVYIKTGNSVYASAAQKAASFAQGNVNAQPMSCNATVKLTAGDTIHLGAAADAASGNRVIYGEKMNASTLCSLIAQRIPPEQFQLWGLEIHWMDESCNTPENRAIVADVIVNYDTLAAEYESKLQRTIIDNANTTAVETLQQERLTTSILKRLKNLEV
jgi:hypothetical protein